MFYDVIIKSKTSFLDTAFTYKSDQDIEIGSRVIVPFGRANKLNLAFIIGKRSQVEDETQIKSIEKIIDTQSLLSQEAISLIEHMVDENLSDYSSAIQTLLPPGDIDRIDEFFSLGLNDDLLSTDVKAFFELPRNYEEIQAFDKKLNRKRLLDLVEKRVLVHDFSTSRKASVLFETTIHLMDSEAKIRKNAYRQRQIVDYLIEHGDSEKNKLLEDTGASLDSLKSLAEKGIISSSRKNIYRDVLTEGIDSEAKLRLNEEQSLALDIILNHEKNHFLLHGVTGSGKTEVYMQVIEKMLKEGKESIMLVPEISLTPQTIRRFQARFGQSIAILHSKLSLSERYDQWRLIKSKKVKIVIGARSAIFAPFDNLGSIIIDESHDTSYQSDRNPKYDTIDIAMLRAKYHNAKLVLGTATPSVESMYLTKAAVFEQINLKNRATNANLPEIRIIDMREELLKQNFSMFSEHLSEKMSHALENKEQIILFLNKRGHTSFVFCRSCGYVHKCEACDVAMTYHSSNGRLICHFCGRTNIKKASCESCGSTFIKEFGAGTQKLEEETRKLFPDANVFRMDADTVKNKLDYDNVYQAMINREIDILIGTQMLTKGFDFPNVSLVGIMAADITLNIPDYKAGEKTFQLLTQVAGRAGRAQTSGHVVIQTYKPDHYAIQAASKNDYYSFYEQELNRRKQFNYPPFINILVINIVSKDRQEAISYSHKILTQIRKYLRQNNLSLDELSGPTPSVVERVNNFYRFNLILKNKNLQDLLKIARHIKTEMTKRRAVFINYSINPDNTL